MTDSTYLEKVRSRARDLQEFFIGTYAEDSIETALATENIELILIAVGHFENLKYQIEEAENATRSEP